jgi:hypothetical protein
MQHKLRRPERGISEAEARELAEGMDYIIAKGDRTRVFKICIEAICGKARR